MSVTNLHNVDLPQILYSNVAPPSRKVLFFKIIHDALLMHSNMLIRIAISSIMRNGTIYILIQTQLNRISYTESNITPLPMRLSNFWFSVNILQMYFEIHKRFFIGNWIKRIFYMGLLIIFWTQMSSQ